MSQSNDLIGEIPAMPKTKIVLKWLGAMSGHIEAIRTHEATISKRQLLRMLYRLQEDLERAASGLTEEIGHLETQLEAELKWRRDNDNE
jgi:hypothetical protein